MSYIEKSCSRRVIDGLLRREEERTPAEDELLQLRTILIEDFEEKHYALSRASPVAAIEFLMDQHELKQKALIDVLRPRH